ILDPRNSRPGASTQLIIGGVIVILVVAAAAGYLLLTPAAPGTGSSSSSGATPITVNIASSTLCKSTKTITIGELNDLSSDLSTEGIPIKSSMAIAISDINKNVTAAGCTVQFQPDVFDYALDNQKAQTQMNTWSSQGV